MNITPSTWAIRVAILVPIDEGLLLIRQSSEPLAAALALPEGRINLGETWQVAGLRQVKEATGIDLKTPEIREFRVCSAPEGTLSIFGLSNPLTRISVATSPSSENAYGCVIINRPVETMASPIYAEVVMAYFGQLLREKWQQDPTQAAKFLRTIATRLPQAV